jgi:hypothetical protein
MQLMEKGRRSIESLSERTSFSLLTASVIYLLLLIAPDKQLNDADTLWHIVLGRKILESGRLPQKDEFSYLFSGEPYQTNSWLSDVLLGGAYGLGGFPAVVLLSTFCVALTFFLLQREYLATLSNRFSIYFCCAIFLLLSPHILSRPHVLAFPLVALWAIVLMRAEANRRPPPLAALPILFLWANMHGSFLLAFVVTGPVCLMDVFGEGWPSAEKIRAWGVFLAGMVAVTVIGPYGLGPLRTAFSVLSVGPLLASIPEWRPEDFSSFGSFEAVLLLTIGLLTHGGVKLSLARMAILLGLLHMALSHTRNADYLAIFGSVLLAAPVALTLSGKDLHMNSKRLLPIVLAVAMAGALATLLLRKVAPRNGTYPAAALQAARDNGAKGNVFNDYSFSGALIFEGMKVFIDSRAEFYSKAFLQNYLDLTDTPDAGRLEGFLKKNDIEWTILPPTGGATAIMGKLPGWREAYRDDDAVVHVRTAGSP